MPEDATGRSWFSYRYAFPGFVFIIFVVLTNLDALIYVDFSSFLNLDLAAIVAILTFLSGPALGFIVTQVYYLSVHFYIRRWFFRKSWHTLRAVRILKETSSFMADIDYWACTEVKKPLFAYLTRRWDLFHVLGSTASTIVIGMIVGYSLRIFGLAELIVDLTVGRSASWNTSTSVISGGWIIVFHTLVIVIATASFCLLRRRALIVRDEHQNMLIKIIEEQS